MITSAVALEEINSYSQAEVSRCRNFLWQLAKDDKAAILGVLPADKKEVGLQLYEEITTGKVSGLVCFARK